MFCKTAIDCCHYKTIATSFENVWEHPENREVILDMFVVIFFHGIDDLEPHGYINHSILCLLRVK